MTDLDALRAAHPIVETVLEAGVTLQRSGRRWRGCCPLHEDRDPSLVLYPETASWFCYGCHAGGDVIDFVARLRRLSFKEALALLGTDAVLPANVTRLPARRLEAPTAEQRALVETAVSHYARTLTRYRDVRAYLAGRGISLETARRLRLGYAAGGLAELLRGRSMDRALAERLGLLVDGRDAMRGRLVVPDLDCSGRATWLVGRQIAGHGPRYLNLRSATPLLGLAQARQVGLEAVVVVEGPFDWLTAAEWSIPAVALLGTHAPRAGVAALAGFATVYLALDADAPGQRATRELAKRLGARAVPVTLPAGVHDLNELGQHRDGRDAFLRALARARKGKEDPWPSRNAPRARVA